MRKIFLAAVHYHVLADERIEWYTKLIYTLNLKIIIFIKI